MHVTEGSLQVAHAPKMICIIDRYEHLLVVSFEGRIHAHAVYLFTCTICHLWLKFKLDVQRLIQSCIIILCHRKNCSLILSYYVKQKGFVFRIENLLKYKLSIPSQNLCQGV